VASFYRCSWPSRPTRPNPLQTSRSMGEEPRPEVTNQCTSAPPGLLDVKVRSASETAASQRLPRARGGRSKAAPAGPRCGTSAANQENAVGHMAETGNCSPEAGWRFPLRHVVLHSAAFPKNARAVFGIDRRDASKRLALQPNPFALEAPRLARQGASVEFEL
jgi:hypothetical protein